MNSETTATPQPNSIPGLLRELRDEATTLLKAQVQLAKVEVKENISRLAGNVAKIAVGGVIALMGAIVLLIGLGQLLGVLLEKAGLSQATAQWLGPVIVGLLVTVVGVVLLERAKKAIAEESIAPRITLQTLKADQKWAQDKLQQSHESRT
ncbi:MAG: phage holin family protein [Opitutus sp.]